MNALTPAQRAMASKPTAKTIARVTAAYLPQDASPIHDFTVRTGWRIRVYASPWTEGALIACADRLVAKDKAQALDCECADLEAVRAWVKGLKI